MEESSRRLVKLILFEIALLFVLVVLVTYLGKFVGVESFRDVLLKLLPPSVMIIFVLVATLLFLSILQPAFKKALSKFLSTYEAQYTWQFIKYMVWAAALLILTFLLIGEPLGVSIFMVLLIIIFIIIFWKALTNFAGWLYIIFRHHLKMGDMVEVDGIKGRIIGITIMNTRLAEAGERFGEPRNTNREVLIPNSYVFSGPIFSIPQKGTLTWDEIRIMLPAKTDHLLARDIITQVAKSIAGPIMKKHRQEMVNNPSSSGSVPSMPIIQMSLEPEGVLVVLTYFCPTSERFEVRSAISENILSEFKKEGIGIAFNNARA